MLFLVPIKERTTMAYEKTQNLIDLTFWMQTDTNGISIQDIMEKYSVSKRTAIRMKDMIKAQYPQIQEIRESSNIKRWYLPKANQDNIIGFSLNEINALQNSIQLAKSRNLNDVDCLESIMHKIKASMNKDAFTRMEPDAEMLLEAQGYVFRPGPKIKNNKEFISQIRLAILGCNKIKIKYDSIHNQDWRTLEPYGLLFGNKHYLIAKQSDKSEMRHFNLNKIKEIQMTDQYFKRQVGFSLQKFSEQSFGVYQEKPFDVEWLFDKEVAKEASNYIFHPKQTSNFNEDGTLTVKFHAGGAREMDWHLYTWGNHVKVIKPENFNELKQWKDF